jgi:TRAP-type C4-dicarboxylate transport system permease small subunit
MGLLGRFYSAVVYACGGAAALLIGAIALGISADVVTRKFGIANLVWMIEAVEYAILVATFLSAPWVLHLGQHVRVDLVVSGLSTAAARRADLAVNVIGFAICAVLLYYGARVAYEAYSLDTKIFRTMVVREWWLLATLPLATALMAVEFVRRFVGGLDANGAQPTHDGPRQD